jgi:hypothetical protein
MAGKISRNLCRLAADGNIFFNEVIKLRMADSDLFVRSSSIF